MQERIEKLADQWDHLVNRSKEKSEKLQEANRQAQYDAGIKDIEFWLGEMETSLASPDYGKDSASVDSLLSKHQVLLSVTLSLVRPRDQFSILLIFHFVYYLFSI